jgi:hypothetical protein
VLSRGGYQWKEGEHKERVKEGFVFMYENRTMKFVEIALGREEERRKKMEGVNLIKIHCKHLCKYHNVSPCRNNMLVKTTI